MSKTSSKKISVDTFSPTNSKLRTRSNSVGSNLLNATTIDKAKWTKFLAKCPCAKSNEESYKIKCSQCKQKWHAPCANISSKLITEKCIEEIEKSWSCPWCYVSPHTRPDGHPSLKCENKLMGTVVSVAVHEKLSETFESQVEEICSNTNRIIKEQLEAHSDKIAEELKKLVDIREELLTKSESTSSTTPQQVLSEADMATRPLFTTLQNPCKHVDDYRENFLDPEEEITKNLASFLGKTKFSQLKGRQVASFGEDYKYVGSPISNIKEIPSQFQALIEKIQSQDQYTDSGLNQIVVNKYTGEEAYLPEHSDDEATIKPESKIFTVTVGAPRTIIFGDKCSGKTEELTPENNSLYVMSQESQFYWSHKIDKESSDLSTRYSITLRSVGKNYKNSTVIIGDSNTKHLRFSQGKPKEIGTFGYMMPGKRVESYHIRQIEPEACIGYRNAIIHCGINDIRDRSPGREPTDPEPSDVEEHFNNLILKIKDIKKLCPYTSIVISPILPTKSIKLNQRVVKFNRLLTHYIMHDKASEGVRSINLEHFVNEEGTLMEKLGVWDTQLNSYNKKDILHLGKFGIRMLANVFRESVLHKFTTSRSYSSATDPSVSRLHVQSAT